MILKLTSLALTFKFICSLRAFHASGTVTGTRVDTDSKQETQIHKLYCYIIIITSYQNDANQFTHSLDFHISLPCLSGLQPITTPEMRQEWSRQHRGTGVRYVRQGDQSPEQSARETGWQEGQEGQKSDHLLWLWKKWGRAGCRAREWWSRLSTSMCLQAENRLRREEGIS